MNLRAVRGGSHGAATYRLREDEHGHRPRQPSPLLQRADINSRLSGGHEGARRMAGAALAGHPMGSVAEAAGNRLSAQYPANQLIEPHKSWCLRELASLQSLVGTLSLCPASWTSGAAQLPATSLPTSAGGPSGLISQEDFSLRLTRELAPLPGA